MARGCPSLHFPLSRLCVRAAIVAAIFCVNGPAVRPAASQPARVTGRVVDVGSGRPIEAVQVRLLGEDAEFSQLTDGWGLFVFRRVPAGEYQLVLDHLAYGTHADSLEVASSEIIEVEARLAMRPIEMEPLEVIVQRRELSARTWRFYERAERGMGHYITWEDIARRRPLRITHMMAEFPGVRLIRLSGLRSKVVLSRYTKSGPGGRLGACWPALYVDGMRVRLNEHETIDDFVFPDDVEGVEVYKGLASVPGDYAGYDARCGVVGIWTRSATTAQSEASGEADRSIWRKLAIAAAIQALVIVVLLAI